MTVSEFAITMYGVDIVKDQVIVMHNGEEVYNDRMEFLRYADEPPLNWWFAGETVLRANMERDRGGDYFTVLVI